MCSLVFVWLSTLSTSKPEESCVVVVRSENRMIPSNILPEDTFAREPELFFIHEFPLFDVGNRVDRFQFSKML